MLHLISCVRTHSFADVNKQTGENEVLHPLLLSLTGCSHQDSLHISQRACTELHVSLKHIHDVTPVIASAPTRLSSRELTPQEVRTIMMSCVCIQDTHFCSAVCDDCALFVLDYVRITCADHVCFKFGLCADYVRKSKLQK